MQKGTKMKIVMSVVILAALSFLFVFSSHCGELKKKSDDKTKKESQSTNKEKTDKDNSDIEDNGKKEDSGEQKDTILDVFLDADVFITAKDKIYYHKEECPKLKGKEVEKIKLSELKKKGKYKPCKACDPPLSQD